jgi:hypothetical protein
MTVGARGAAGEMLQIPFRYFCRTSCPYWVGTEGLNSFHHFMVDRTLDNLMYDGNCLKKNENDEVAVRRRRKRMVHLDIVVGSGKTGITDQVTLMCF